MDFKITSNDNNEIIADVHVAEIEWDGESAYIDLPPQKLIQL